MDNPSRVRMSGPLEPYRHGFTADLRRLGYSKFTVVALLHLMAHLSRWLEDQGLGTDDLTDDCVERFLAVRRASGQVRRLSPRGLIPLLDYLRGLDVAWSGCMPRHVAPARAATLRGSVPSSQGVHTIRRAIIVNSSSELVLRHVDILFDDLPIHEPRWKTC